MSNHVPAASERARLLIKTDIASRRWRLACEAFAHAHPRYQTRWAGVAARVAAKTPGKFVLRRPVGGVPSGLPNYMALMALALQCGYSAITDANVGDAIAAMQDALAAVKE